MLAAVLALLIWLSRVAPDLVTWERWQSTGYLGLFVLCLISSGGLALPVPALLAVFLAGQTLSPIVVAIVAALGMTLGEITGYLLGSGSRMALAGLSREKQSKWDRWTGKTRGFVNRFGAFAIAFLALIPNPLFDVAGAAAGAAGMPLWKFLGAVAVGRLAKTLLVAMAGAYALEWFRPG